MLGEMLDRLHTLLGLLTSCFAMLGDVWSRSNISPKFHCSPFKSLLVLQNFSTARKSGNISWHTEKLFFVRHSSEYETPDNDRKVIHNYIARCGYTWLDESKWPQEWPISPITIITWRFQEKRWNLSVYTRLGFESWYKQIPKHLNERTICLAQWFGSLGKADRPFI